MSNTLQIQPTKFEDARTGKISLGYRAFDNYGQTYNNLWDSIPEDDMEFLKKVVEDCNESYSSEQLQDMIDSLQESETTIIIGDATYTYEQIKDILPD